MSAILLKRLRNWTPPCLPLCRATAVPLVGLPLPLGARASPAFLLASPCTDLPICEALQTIRSGDFLATRGPWTGIGFSIETLVPFGTKQTWRGFRERSYGSREK